MNAHGRCEAFIPEHIVRRVSLNAHGRCEAFIPEHVVRKGSR